jgi:hypothetical protein
MVAPSWRRFTTANSKITGGWFLISPESRTPCDGQKVFQFSRTGFFNFKQDALEDHGRCQRISKGRVPFRDFDVKMSGDSVQILIAF